MITNRDILTWLQALAPPELAESWDNNGLLCGRLDAPAGRVLVALDPFLPAAEEAADWGAGLLLTHHPLLFRPARAVTDETALGRTMLFLIEHGIAAVNAHTCLDYAPGGVNDVLAQSLACPTSPAAGCGAVGACFPSRWRCLPPMCATRWVQAGCAIVILAARSSVWPSAAARASTACPSWPRPAMTPLSPAM